MNEDRLTFEEKFIKVMIETIRDPLNIKEYHGVSIHDTEGDSDD